ncbi:MAG: ImmA/IrrE family metallo-endopeptidase [bacterium]|nr:ImmA/IrrE family metallo-endopeptidase [bacterium]
MSFQIICPFIRKEELWERAEHIRTTYRENESLPIDSDLICEKSGMHIVPTTDMPEIFDCCIILNRNELCVNWKRYMDDRNENRLRFTFAHELGHFVLHRSILEELSLQTIDDYLEFLDAEQDEAYLRFEFQANEFAGRLLVPRDLLKERLDKLISSIPSDQRPLVADNIEYFKELASKKICGEFGVSPMVIAIRLEREGLWPPRL